jgi:hypothetical protein
MVEEKNPVLKYSPRRIAIAMENGVEIAIARNEVMSVPIRNGRAPKSPVTGFQSDRHKNEKPNSLIEAEELKRSVRKIPDRRRITPVDIDNRVALKRVSPVAKLFSFRVLTLCKCNVPLIGVMLPYKTGEP